jgi:hypothetical protein
VLRPDNNHAELESGATTTATAIAKSKSQNGTETYA